MREGSPAGFQGSERALFESDLGLPGLRRGKVRDVYPLATPGDPRLVIVASDRISAFDVVMPTPVPGKGRLLTALSTFWLRFIADRAICRTHLISTDASLVPAAAFTGRTRREDLEGRTTIARTLDVVPIECVVRGYLEGSGWREYRETGSICGVRLPAGLRQADRLPEPIFTPATKEELGRHDVNVDFAEASRRVGGPLMERLRDLSLSIYAGAADHALRRGIIIADTKFEFGLDARDPAAGPVLCDEALTPDSSRFWPVDRYGPGRAQQSFDKQFLREYLESLVARGEWNKQAPGPRLPDEIVAATREKYGEALARLTSGGA